MTHCGARDGEVQVALIEGRATFTIDTSSTTMNWARHAIVEDDPVGRVHGGVATAAGSRTWSECNGGVCVATCCSATLAFAPHLMAWPPSSSSPCATFDASTRRTEKCCKGINLSFYPGAKIGVIGANGSGKTSLLRIMAGLDDGFTGEARLTPGFSVGYLSQEPQLDPSKDVVGNVADGVAEQRDLLVASTKSARPWATPTRTSTPCSPSRPRCRPGSTRWTPGTWNGRSRSPWTHCDCRRPTPTWRRCRVANDVASRCADCCCPSPISLARRADEPSRRRVGGVARANPAGLQRHRRRDHPRPLLPRQRGVVDPGARPRSRHPVGG